MQTKFRGVNLGGWLVLEKWITPRLFTGLKAEDERSFCLALGSRAAEVLEQHRKTFITRKDFAWMAERGLNAVRIPLGHGIFGDAPPFVGAIDSLDFAVTTARDYGLSVILDLHTAPGSQNGWDHSGQQGEIAWPANEKNIEQTLSVLERLADRYKDQRHVVGIEVLNEPHWTIEKPILENYYTRAQNALRQSGYKNKIVIHDGFDPWYWSAFLETRDFENSVLDLHLYQCFTKEDKELTITGHLEKTRGEWAEMIAQIQKKTPVLIGEWSLGLDPISLKGVGGESLQKAYRDYAQAQIDVFEKTQGWFFWTYKTETMVHWSFRDCVERGLLPGRF